MELLELEGFFLDQAKVAVGMGIARGETPQEGFVTCSGVRFGSSLALLPQLSLEIVVAGFNGVSGDVQCFELPFRLLDL